MVSEDTLQIFTAISSLSINNYRIVVTFIAVTQLFIDMNRKICLLRLSAIGDVCHAVALVNRIQQAWPDTELTWIIGKVEYPLVRNMRGVRFVVFDKRQGKQAIQDLERSLADTHFDALLLMQVAFRANWISRVIKAKRRIGFDWHRSKELHWWFVNERVKPHPHAHVLEGFMDFADALAVPAVENLRWDIPIDADAQAWADAVKDDLGRYAIISPAASKAERNWLPERYAAVAEYLTQQGLQVVLCGGPAAMDRDLADAIKKASSQTLHDVVGKTSLQQLLALIKSAALVIAPDTGPAHMATTVGTKVVGLYAHSNPRRTGPYNSLMHTVSVYDECVLEQYKASWQTLPWGTRVKGADLMARISVVSVIEKIDMILHT